MQKQSAKIKELVQDLNLVSQLEYEMQPLHKEMVRLSKLLRSYVADLLNTGISDSYNIGIKITPDAENAVLECDARLISRAVNNLVQNSMKHNPQGCEVCISLTTSQNHLILAVTDNGMGLSAEKLQELEEKPHYMENTDERLDLRHGLGLLIVQQVAISHNGKLFPERVAELSNKSHQMKFYQKFQTFNVFPKGCEAFYFAFYPIPRYWHKQACFSGSFITAAQTCSRNCFSSRTISEKMAKKTPDFREGKLARQEQPLLY